MIDNWSFNRHDEEVVKDFTGFVPDNVFDIHAHIYRVKDLNSSKEGVFSQGPDEAGIGTWRECVGKALGKTPQKALFMPFPAAECDIDASNIYLTEQLAAFPDNKGLILVSPDYPEELAGEYLKNAQIAGFKPYHVFSRSKPTFDSAIDAFVPGWVWKTANERNLVVMLHLVKDKALADEENIRLIREKCMKYPGMKLILAHAGRGFHAPNTIKGVKALRGLGNVWFDTSGICEPASIKAILDEFGPTRILWGSDFPVSQIRGKCVIVGDSFIWNQQDTIRWENLTTPCNPVLVGIESIRALKEAADDFGLNRADMEDIFHHNAAELLGITEKTGTKVQELYKHAKSIIPGGVQLLSKRPEMFAPGQWPAYFREARGCEVWDLDGRHYYDMSTNGIGSCLLGYRDPDVTRAVTRRINLGAMSTLNPPEEVYLADKLLEIHPWAEQVRFARTGGEVAAMAVRIARATTDRSVIAISGYHGWHDWYLAANLGENDALRGHLLPGLEPMGVPGELRNTAVPFKHGSREEFQKVLERHGDKLAAVIMEPCRHKDPEKGFLEFVRSETARRGILLIFDEITIGWRRNFGGAHLELGVNPDVAIFAKALGNGHPIAAAIGTKNAMNGAHYSFISSTYWTESVGPAAALAVIDKLWQHEVAGYVGGIGSRVMCMWKEYGQKYGLPVVIEDGYPCLAHFKFDHSLSQQLNTLYVQLMLERGFLAGVSIYPTFAHTEQIVDLYGEAIDEVFSIIAGYLKEGTVEKILKGPVAHSGFRRLL